MTGGNNVVAVVLIIHREGNSTLSIVDVIAAEGRSIAIGVSRQTIKRATLMRSQPRFITFRCLLSIRRSVLLVLHYTFFL